ncbi:MAG TPA: FecR domain-containing protein [Geothrix sp.]|jgi:hypothetical protein
MNLMLAPLLFTLLQAPAPAPEALTYRFEEVKRSVLRQPGGDKAKEIKIAKGDSALPGDGVTTGWWAQTTISVPERASRFEVYANTQVKLASGEPGVLLIVERGRIKAFFQSLVEGNRQERQVAVPGALLAVRGTRYGVEVDKNGKSTLVVFEGVVEVLHKTPHTESIRVKAGEWATFGPNNLPQIQPMSMRGFQEGSWSQGMRPDGTMGPGAMAPGSMQKGSGPMGPGPMHH